MSVASESRGRDSERRVALLVDANKTLNKMAVVLLFAEVRTVKHSEQIEKHGKRLQNTYRC